MNPLRLIIGTLTILPIKAPDVVNSRVAGQAATLSPLAGALLALMVAFPAWMLGAYVSPLLAAALCLAAITFLTRALHLDGLADTADGLGAHQGREGTLEVMRQSDIGPFGVVTLMLALLVQVAALSACFAAGRGAPALAIALILSRAVLPQLCRLPAARADGLGISFAGNTNLADVAVATTLAVILTVPIALVSGVLSTDGSLALVAQILLQPVAWLPAWWLQRKVVQRIGGLTGDVYGAALELAFTASLVLAAVSVSA